MLFSKRKSKNKVDTQTNQNKGDVELFDTDGFILDVGKAKRPLSSILPLLYFVLTIALIFGLQAYYFNKTNRILIDKDIESLEHSNDLVSILIKNYYESSQKTILELSNIDNVYSIKNIQQVDSQVDIIVGHFLKNREYFQSISIFDPVSQNRLKYEFDSEKSMYASSITRAIVPQRILDRAIINMAEGEVYFSGINNNNNNNNNKSNNNSEVFDSVNLVVNIFTKIPRVNDEHVNSSESQSNSLFLNITIDIGRFLKRTIVANLSEIEFYIINDAGEYVFKPNNTIPLSPQISDDFPVIKSAIEKNTSSHAIQPNFNRSIPYPGYYSLLNLSQFGVVVPYRVVLFYYDPKHVNQLSNATNSFIVFGVGLSILIWFLIWLITYFCFRPLRRISQAISDYEDNGSVAGLPINAKDELGVISRSFYNLLRNKEQRELDLDKTRRYLEGITNKSPVHLAYVDLQETYHFVNKTLQEFLCKDESELVGLSIKDIAGDNYCSMQPYIHRVLKGELVQFTTEFTVENKTSSILKFTLNPSFNIENEVVGFYICADDITDITSATKKIHDLSQRLEIALVIPGIGVWEYDIDSGEHLWDQQMYDIYNIENTPIDRSISALKKFVHPDDYNQLIETIRFSSIDQDASGIFRIIWPDNSIRWIETHFRVIKNKSGKPVRVIGTNTDITSRKELEIEKDAALQKAKESTKLKSEFLASMSHEIRTPMNGVMGMLGLLKNTSLTKRQKYYISLATSSADSLLMLINDILDFSKVEAGKVEIDNHDFQLPDMLAEVVESMSQRAQEKDVEIILDLTQVTATHVKGDANRIRQVLSNLLGNAIKFTNHGEINVIAALTKKDDDNYEFRCDVIDTGVGIAKNKQHLLFNSFSQVDASTTRKYGGTGLGLAIVKQLCQLMGGDVAVESEENKGSRFSFTIQLMQSQFSETLKPKTTIDTKSILVVDDNINNLSVIEKQLTLWGAQVQTCTSGSEALACIEGNSSSFNLIIVDEIMPKLDGKTVVKKIRANSQLDHIPIVLMTHLDLINLPSTYDKLGLSGFFPKPTTVNDLFYCLELSDKLNKTVANNQHPSNAPLNAVGRLNLLNSRPEENLAQSTLSILLVEDNSINQEVALGMISQQKFDVVIANNGIEALKILNDTDQQIDLILMDCQMPEMDGYQASRAIRNGGAPNPQIPIIAMTANAMKGDKEKCLSAGMNAYISKPIDPIVLIETIHEWSGNHVFINEIEINKNSREEVANMNITPEPDTIWDRDDFMNRIMNNSKIADKLFTLFKSDTPITIKQLGEAVESGEIDEASKIAHKLKGSVSNLGGIELAGLAKKIEQAGIDQNLAEVKQLWPNVLPQYEKLLAEIKSGLGS